MVVHTQRTSCCPVGVVHARLSEAGEESSQIETNVVCEAGARRLRNVLCEVFIWVFLSSMRLSYSIGDSNYDQAQEHIFKTCFGTAQWVQVQSVYQKMFVTLDYDVDNPEVPNELSEENKDLLQFWKNYHEPTKPNGLGHSLVKDSPLCVLISSGTPDDHRDPGETYYDLNHILLGPAWYHPSVPDSISGIRIYPGVTTVQDFSRIRTRVLAHELTHIRNIAFTDDHEYGILRCVGLAHHYPDAALDNADNYAFHLTVSRLINAYPEYDFSDYKIVGRTKLLHHFSGFTLFRHPSAGSVRDLPGYDESKDKWYQLYGTQQATSLQDLHEKLKPIVLGQA